MLIRGSFLDLIARWPCRTVLVSSIHSRQWSSYYCVGYIRRLYLAFYSSCDYVNFYVCHPSCCMMLVEVRYVLDEVLKYFNVISFQKNMRKALWQILASEQVLIDRAFYSLLNDTGFS